MSQDEPRDERIWEVGWDGHSDAQRRRLARLPLVDKIRWLEEAQKLAERMRQSREKLDKPGE